MYLKFLKTIQNKISINWKNFSFQHPSLSLFLPFQEAEKNFHRLFFMGLKLLFSFQIWCRNVTCVSLVMSYRRRKEFYCIIKTSNAVVGGREPLDYASQRLNFTHLRDLRGFSSGNLNSLSQGWDAVSIASLFTVD